MEALLVIIIGYFLFVFAIHHTVKTPAPTNLVDFLYQTLMFPLWCLEERWNDNYDKKEKQEHLDNGYYWGDDEDEDS
jgi:hypothetical protein